ncbi:MAG: YbdD/YjiX family protein [Gemmatimonadaceae bacterium]
MRRQHESRQNDTGSWVARVAAVARAILGVPDYQRYVAHLARHQPGEAPLSEREFARRSLEERYARPGSRCC